MKKLFFTILFITVLCPINIHAQSNLLTNQEILSIVTKIPDVANALKGGCPSFSISTENWGSDIVSVQVRFGCGPHSGQLIDNYQINKRNGATTKGWDNPLYVLDSEGEAFAKRLVVQAQKRILSLDEARCLAYEAAKTLMERKNDDIKLSVMSNGIASSENVAIFIVTDISATQTDPKERALRVYLDEARISDDNDVSVMSSNIDDLVSKLRELRAPTWLTEKEVTIIARTVPEITIELKDDDCKLYADATHHPFPLAFANVGCNNATIRKTSVYVNLQTGEITDPETGEPLDSHESKQISRHFFDQKTTHKAQLQKEIDAICKP
jgi:hypothetical protein